MINNEMSVSCQAFNVNNKCTKIVKIVRLKKKCKASHGFYTG